MKKVIIAMVMLTVAGLVQADVIVSWNNDGQAGNEAGPISADTTGANVDSGSLGRGAGATATSYTHGFAMRNRIAATLADAITDGRYLSITVSAASGYSMDLEDLFLRLDANNLVNGCEISLLSDQTGLTASDEIWSVTPASVSTTHTITLDTISELQGVTDVEFRVYAWGGSNQYDAFSIGKGYFADGNDDVILNGTVTAVPEPATIGMLGFGAVVSLLARRIRS